MERWYAYTSGPGFACGANAGRPCAWGAIKAATIQLQKQGMKVSACQLRYVHPLPEGLEALMKSFKQVIVPELNLGQLRFVLQANFATRLKGINKVKGQPFTVHEIVDEVKKLVVGS